MYVGNVLVEVFLPAVSSLKGKRRIIQSLLTKLKNRYNISVAEVDNQDLWQRSSIGISYVNSSHKNVQQMLERMISYIDSRNEMEIIDKDVTIQAF